MELNLQQQQSCDDFTLGTITSSDINIPYGQHSDKLNKAKKSVEVEATCSNLFSSTSSTSSNTILSQYFDTECRKRDATRKDPPNIDYELNVAKAIMQQYSSISGDNLFDHLSDIIKRVIDERPPNIIDFFEEFSRNVREQKLHLPERFPPDGVFEESRMYRVSKKLLLSMKLPMPRPDELPVADEMLPLEESKTASGENLKLDILDMSRFISFNERVQHLQFYWNQCGFGINADDIFQLACAIDRLQTHPSIMQCRFWGMMTGLKASYYIVEASLAHEEVHSRVDEMSQELKEMEKEILQQLARDEPPPQPSFIGPEMIPGKMGWDNHPIEELEKMLPAAAPIPVPKIAEIFNVPPEMVGSGTNRFSYFVINSVSDDWIELPMVTPQQINASRDIKKFLTGDLEANIETMCPCFPGKEKHYLRALIARITAGTYIAPQGYYRKMTKKEMRAYYGMDDDDGEEGEEDEEEEEEEPIGMGEDEEEKIDNDVILLKNEKYEPETVETLINLEKWLHVRPNILNQGRVVWFDELKAQKERDKEVARLKKQLRQKEMDEEEDDLEEQAEEDEEEEDDEDNGADGEGEDMSTPEIGPPIFHSCYYDTSDQYTIPWVARFTSKYTNRNERLLVMQSNVWPGAYTFTFGKLCESIYIGWGHKYVARNMAFKHLPPIVNEYLHAENDFIESTDPTAEEEQAYWESLLRKEEKMDTDGEELGGEEDSDEYDTDTDTGDDDK